MESVVKRERGIESDLCRFSTRVLIRTTLIGPQEMNLTMDRKIRTGNSSESGRRWSTPRVSLMSNGGGEVGCE